MYYLHNFQPYLEDKNNRDRDALLKFMQDAECLESLAKWTNEFNLFDVLKVSQGESDIAIC